MVDEKNDSSVLKMAKDITPEEYRERLESVQNRVAARIKAAGITREELNRIVNESEKDRD